MAKNKIIRQELNRKSTNGLRKTLKPAWLYTHTHTHTPCLLVNSFAKNIENINRYMNKDRTVLWNYSIGLSLCVFVRAGVRDGPSL